VEGDALMLVFRDAAGETLTLLVAEALFQKMTDWGDEEIQLWADDLQVIIGRPARPGELGKAVPRSKELAF
jgi:hypothetical protein